jgi:GrpB-like predicted nucleotidyltransferase (UPF0157 family)/ribosomal protein S18 acetylase RimI-like enzyme
MPPPIPVVLAKYDPGWPKRAAKLAKRLQVLGSTLLAVEHIGSTAIPGMAAKPIIDLMPLVTTLADLDHQRPRVEALGYEWHGELGLTGRRYCTLADERGVRAAQLHFFEAESPHATRHIAFRDYMRSHPEAARAYEIEKRRAQKLHPNDSHAYTDEKSAWIRDAEIDALTWFRAQQSVRCDSGRVGRTATTETEPMISIQRATSSDAFVFKEIRLRALQDTPLAFGSTYARELQFDDSEWLRRANGEQSILLLAMDDGVACGMAGALFKQDEPAHALLVSMWVAPTHRQRGIGRKLVEEVLASVRLRGARILDLMVTSGNGSAMAFYEHLGFSLTGRTEPYPNDPALVEYEMSRPVD